MLPLPDDADYMDEIVGSISSHTHYSLIILSRGGCVSLPFPKCPRPSPGDKIRLYFTKKVGTRGVILNGRVIFYDPPAQQECVAPATVTVEPTSIFAWTADMGNATGASPEIEEIVRQIISRGCEWWSEHPAASPFNEVQAKAELRNAMGEARTEVTVPMCWVAEDYIKEWRRIGSWVGFQKHMRQLSWERSVRGVDDEVS